MLVPVATITFVNTVFKVAGALAASATALIASSGNAARPRFVCKTVPVRLCTGRSDGNANCARFSVTVDRITFVSGMGLPAVPSVRALASAIRIA